MPVISKKVAVIYKSNYGSTKRYAEWIAEAVHGDLFERSQIKANDLSNYDVIVYGGSLHAVGIKGVKIIADNFNKFKDKKIIVYGVGASPAREEAIKAVFDKNFAENIKEKVNFFMLRGAFDYSNLSVGDKILMNMLKHQLEKKKPEELDEDMKGLLACYSEPADWTDKAAIAPIIDCIYT